METIWLGLGSNLGDGGKILGEAIKKLSLYIESLQCSKFWKSKARYLEDQPDFTNAVARGSTSLEPGELLSLVHDVENEFGRSRAGVPSKGPRTLDIDILLYGNRIIAESDLIVPHPGMRERKFVLLPMLEIDIDVRDPVSGRHFRDFLADLPPQGIYPIANGHYDAPYP